MYVCVEGLLSGHQHGKKRRKKRDGVASHSHAMLLDGVLLWVCVCVPRKRERTSLISDLICSMTVHANTNIIGWGESKGQRGTICLKFFVWILKSGPQSFSARGGWWWSVAANAIALHTDNLQMAALLDQRKKSWSFSFPFRSPLPIHWQME